MDRNVDRRDLLKSAVASGAVASGIAGGLDGVAAQEASPVSAEPMGPPNVLVITVDQLRGPMAPFTQELMDQAMPNLAMLRKRGVEFSNQYIAGAMCSPSRSCFITGLYTHQNGMLLTNTEGITGIGELDSPSLNPGFPTYGTYASSLGYQTPFFGKWHCSTDDHKTGYSLERFGFTHVEPTPSPNGGPGQGMNRDDDIAALWTGFIRQRDQAPFCATVAFVNPHDIAYYPVATAQVPNQDSAPSIFTELPANWEDPVDNAKRGKPAVQRQMMLSADLLFGQMPYFPEDAPIPANVPDGFPLQPIPGFPEMWFAFMDLYVKLCGMVDQQIGKVLKELSDSPYANNTIVIFTSDHGEYIGAHGLRGKGGALYEESIRVPLYIADPTGTFQSTPGQVRDQLTSSVDVLPFIMTAIGGDAWRSDPAWSHLLSRLDLAAIMRDEATPGRDYIVTTSDEEIIETGSRIGRMEAAWFTENVPQHAIAVRTRGAKIGVYSFFTDQSLQPLEEGRQLELYDYTTADGALEITNAADSNPVAAQRNAALQAEMLALFDRAVAEELQAPLPDHLQQAQQEAMTAYHEYIAAFTQVIGSVNAEEG